MKKRLIRIPRVRKKLGKAFWFKVPTIAIIIVGFLASLAASFMSIGASYMSMRVAVFFGIILILHFTAFGLRRKKPKPAKYLKITSVVLIAIMYVLILGGGGYAWFTDVVNTTSFVILIIFAVLYVWGLVLDYKKKR